MPLLRLAIIILCGAFNAVQLDAKEANNMPTFGMVILSPYVYFDHESNQCMGKTIDITKMIMAEYKVPLEVICGSPSRIYKGLQVGDVNFTINTKTISNEIDNTFMVKPVFSEVKVNLYSHLTMPNSSEIAVTRDYEYQGVRKQLRDQGYKFVDLPTGLSAFTVFFKKKSQHLLSFSQPIEQYLRDNAITLSKDIKVETLHKVQSNYVIMRDSRHFEVLRRTLTDYASKHNIEYFNPDN